MLSKYSVKRPYTVLVAVVAVIVIGVVAVTRMTMDLLPNITLPYVVVITTDIGASPEEVEAQITAPVEASLATTSNLKNIQSASYNSYSTVILEYEQTSNMDSIMIEIQQKMDQVKAGFPDTAGAPIVMQINPNMLPIMVAAVSIDGYDSLESGDYVKTDIAPQLEGIEGVASVSVSGGVTESIQVTLNQDKIDKLNKKIVQAIDDQFIEATVEIEKNKKELENGKAELESGKQQMADQLAAGKTQLETQKIQLYATAADLDQNLLILNAAKGILEQALGAVNSVNERMIASRSQAEALQSIVDLYDNGTLNDEQFLEANGFDIEQARELLNTYNTQQRDMYEEIRKNLEPVLSGQMNIEGVDAEALRAALDGPEETVDIQQVIGILSDTLTQVNVGIETINSAKVQIESGKVQLDTAMEALNKNETLGELQIAEAQSQIMLGESGLQSAEQTIEKTKEEAKAAADLNTVLSLDTVNGILVAQNFEMPAGYAGDYLVKVGEDIPDIKELENLVLIDLGMDGLDEIRLTDIADVELVNDSAEVYARVNNAPGILLTFEKQTGYSTGTVTDNIIDKFASLEKTLDKPTHFSVLMDQGVYIDIIIKSIVQNILVGAGLAILILIIFLRDIRPTIIIGCAIPLSIIFAVVLMYFTGITLNIISLSGLTLGIGMLVDNSIVVIENIYRMIREEKMSIKKAAVYGAGQVSGAITASTLTTICVFLPIVFTEGITRQIFVDMGLTIAYTLTASLVVALTLVPAMAQGLLKKTEEKEQKRGKIYERYGKFLSLMLKIKPVVLIFVVLLLVGSIGFALKKGTAFMPAMEGTQITVTLSPPDDVEKTVEEMTGYSNTLMERVVEIEDVQTVGAMIGENTMLGSLGGSSGNNVTMYVLLDDKTKTANAVFAEKIMEAASDLDCKVNVNTEMMDMSMLTGDGIKVQIKGRNMETLKSLSQQVYQIIQDTEGLENLDNGMGETIQEFVISVDKLKAARYNMTVAQVFQLVASKLSSSKSMTSISTDIKDISIYVNTDEQSEMTVDDIKKITFEYQDRVTGDKEDIELSRIATFSTVEEPATIKRDAQQRYLEVSANVADGYNVGLLGSEISRKLTSIGVPEGYSIKLTGEDEMINDAMEQVVLMLILAVILIYLVMVAQFQSLLSPFIIMFTIPLAFTGGFFALYLSDNPVSVIAMVGFVMLSGIIVNNGIVLVDYINQLRREGKSKKDAIIEASATRLRPVFMTALTTIISMSTMAVGMGKGTEMAQPMAIVVVGGMIYGTLLTLVVVPCIYDLFNREKDMTEEEI